MADSRLAQANVTVAMIRDNLEHIPKFELPSAYSVRWYESGDEAAWARIQRAADKFNDITDTLFFDQFGLDKQIIHERQCYVCHGDEQIGTGTAWFDENYGGKPYGRVHWIAIAPSRQGLGLSKALMTIICDRMKELNHQRAYLTTGSARIPAINLYMLFGFRPDINTLTDYDVWMRINSELKYPYPIRVP